MAPFKKALHQLLDKEGYGWVVEGGDVFCAMLQAAGVKAAKSTVTSGKGTFSTNVADYQKKDLQTAFTNASVTTSVLLELIANRKTVLWAHHADHEKMGMTEEELALINLLTGEPILPAQTANQYLVGKSPDR
jgi:predicted solute-binding protein